MSRRRSHPVLPDWRGVARWAGAAALPFLAACAAPGQPDEEAPTLTPAERAFEQRVQDGIDRFARFTHAGPHVRELALGAPRQPEVRRPLARALAREAFASTVRPGDTLRVLLHAPRRIGPLAFDGRTQRFTFTEPPAPAAAATALP